MEIQQCAGLCKCGNKLIMKIAMIPKEEDPKKESKSWVVHGVCKKCDTASVQELFFQEEEPMLNRDYIVNWNKKVKATD